MTTSESNCSVTNPSHSDPPKRSLSIPSFKIGIYIGVLFFSVVAGFFSFVTAESVRHGDYFVNETANALRSLIGVQAVIEIESYWMHVKDQCNQWLYQEDVTLNASVQQQLDTADRIVKVIKRVESSVQNLSDESIHQDRPIVHPPDPLPILIEKPFLDGEGTWEALPISSSAEPRYGAPFYQTFIRPDRHRSYSKVDLISIDLQQVDLHLVFGQGYLDMQNQAGTGCIPEAHLDRLIGAFNGGFLQVHDKGGFTIAGEERIPLMFDEATFFLYEDQTAEICSYNAQKASAIHRQGKSIVLAFQNQPPIMINNQINEQVKTWGLVYMGKDWFGDDVLSRTAVFGHRSALGITEDQRLVYAIGDSVSAQTLGYALKLAGCTDAMHLDLNPTHICFAYFTHDEATSRVIPHKVSQRSSSLLAQNFLRKHRQGYFYMLRPNDEAHGSEPRGTKPGCVEKRK